MEPVLLSRTPWFFCVNLTVGKSEESKCAPSRGAEADTWQSFPGWALGAAVLAERSMLG